MIRLSVEALTVEPILARADPFADDTGPKWIEDTQIQFLRVKINQVNSWW